MGSMTGSVGCDGGSSASTSLMSSAMTSRECSTVTGVSLGFSLFSGVVPSSMRLASATLVSGDSGVVDSQILVSGSREIG